MRQLEFFGYQRFANPAGKAQRAYLFFIVFVIFFSPRVA
jgi:hypothetical protein